MLLTFLSNIAGKNIHTSATNQSLKNAGVVIMSKSKVKIERLI